MTADGVPGERAATVAGQGDGDGERSGERPGELDGDGHGWSAEAGVEIVAPSRLHFGLLSWGNSGRRFGGVGVMIEPPSLRLIVETCSQAGAPRDRLDAHGDSNGIKPSEMMETCERIAELRRRWTAFHRWSVGPSLRWRVLAAPPRHSGLGSGTQWGLAVAAALDVLSGRVRGLGQGQGQGQGQGERTQTVDSKRRSSEQWVREAAASVGRGARSAIGAYGFVFGGFILEPGKLEDEALSPLEHRAAIPEDWRFVLVCPRTGAGDAFAGTASVEAASNEAAPTATAMAGLHGAAERTAFASLPPVPTVVTERLRAIAVERLAPAVERGDCAEFGDAVYEYGVIAGNCFAPVQGGPFNGPVLTELVARMRALGARGVGQSSWGPTVFAVLPNDAEAASFARAIADDAAIPVDVQIAAANNRGAVIRHRVFEETVSSERSSGQ
jgi:predicted sugar kinase